MLNHRTVPIWGIPLKKTLLWDLKRNQVAWKLYLDDLYSIKPLPKYAVPILETNLKGLPPAYTFVGTDDPFYEDTTAYAIKMKQAGVDVVCKVYEAGYHAFDVVEPNSKMSKKALKDLLVAYKLATETYK